MTSEEKLTRIMNGAATPEHRIEMLRELIADEVAKQLQKPPIPGPSFEGGAGEKWEPKKGDHVQVLRDVAFLKKDEIATVVEVTVDRGVGFAFFCEGALLGWVPFSDLAPVKVIGYDSKAAGGGEPTRPKIIPAEPLREMPEDDKMYVYVAEYQDQSVSLRQFFSVTTMWLESGRVFPYTPEGKAGAELRASEGIVPYPKKSNPAKIETLISEIERMIFEVQTETEFRSEFDFMNEKLEEIRNEVAAMFQEPTPK